MPTAKKPVTVTRVASNAVVFAGVKRLQQLQVLVGITTATAYQNEGHPDINNAELLWIHSHGSPLQNIPERAVLEPAIEAEDNKARIAREFKAVGQAALRGDESAAMLALNRAGQAGVNAAQSWFTDPRNGWPPDSDETVARKLGKLAPKAQDAALRKIEKAGGVLTGIVTTLVDTDDMRKAITYVIKDAKNET